MKREIIHEKRSISLSTLMRTLMDDVGGSAFEALYLSNPTWIPFARPKPHHLSQEIVLDSMFHKLFSLLNPNNIMSKREREKKKYYPFG